MRRKRKFCPKFYGSEALEYCCSFLYSSLLNGRCISLQASQLDQPLTSIIQLTLRRYQRKMQRETKKIDYESPDSPGPEDLVNNLALSKEGHEGPGAPLTTRVRQNVVDIPMKYRIGAFVFILFFSTGSAFAEATIGPLKSTLLKQLEINSESDICTSRRMSPKYRSLLDRHIVRRGASLTCRYPIQYHLDRLQCRQHHPTRHRRYRYGLCRRRIRCLCRLRVLYHRIRGGCLRESIAADMQ